jgi:hypothetical protein
MQKWLDTMFSNLWVVVLAPPKGEFYSLDTGRLMGVANFLLV